MGFSLYTKFKNFQVLGHPRWSTQKWSVESVHSKNLVAILHLLVALARHFRAPVRLPENVAVAVVVVQVSIIIFIYLFIKCNLKCSNLSVAYVYPCFDSLSRV